MLAAVFVAEIGDITRFHRPERLASWAGLTPKYHESDTTVHRGRITKQGLAAGTLGGRSRRVQRVSGRPLSECARRDELVDEGRRLTDRLADDDRIARLQVVDDVQFGHAP